MLAMVLALAVAQGPVTPATPLRYRLEVKTASDQDLTSVGKGTVSGTLTTTATISVTLTDSADGQIARVTVDSMALDPTGAMLASLPLAAAAAAADSARGAFVQAYTVHGTIRGAPRGSSPNPALQSIFQAIGVLFPGLRSNIKVGDRWADTTVVNNDVQNGAGRQVGRVIATWKVTGMENGGFVLDGTAATAVTTNGKNGEMLRVTGASLEHLVMASQGPTRSATIDSSNDISATSPRSATPIPARSVGSLKLIPLP